MTGAVTAVQVGSSPRCKSCHAAIWFGLTAKGHRMPLDPAPVDDGNVVIERVDAVIGVGAEDPMPRVRVLRSTDVVGRDTPRYVSHFATCPSADRHRKTRASAAPADRGSSAAAPSVGTGGAQGLSFGEVANGTGAAASRGGRRG